ncbi:MAG: 5-oxoprolinase subunit PxpB [Chthoniobacterales bacterium]
MTIHPLGDSALTVHIGPAFAADPDGCLREVSVLYRRLEAANLPDVREIAPAFASIGVFYEPKGEEAFAQLSARIREIASAEIDEIGPAGHIMEIPICYDPEFGPDLPHVAAHSHLSAEEVVAAHVAAAYRVSCIGFSPGFPYLAGLPRFLATPRRLTPRTRVKAGSVGIGGVQTGIYPQSSPGGWNIIGRTPQRLFDPLQEPPAFLQMGDAVRIRSITRAEFDSLINP